MIRYFNDNKQKTDGNKCTSVVNIYLIKSFVGLYLIMKIRFNRINNLKNKQTEKDHVFEKE